MMNFYLQFSYSLDIILDEKIFYEIILFIKNAKAII